MYKYSKKAQEKFFSSPFLSFLFAWFASSQEGIKFTYQKFEKKGHEYYGRIKSEIDELKCESLDLLKRNAVGISMRGDKIS